MALSDTPNNKAPGSDGIPSEQILRPSAPYRTVLQTEGHWDWWEVTQRYLGPLQVTENSCCPASPILFDFHINDLLNGIKGVYVPGFTSRIPGLLFADDTMLLAESETDMQIALNQITDWSSTWEMTVNESKCGSMNVTGP
ncbi:hypothetical protein AYI68_g5039 [Smittium mucronatum]|uniref:Reverse transcriptase domain-containing protein n=1 Tax=Smittium mucronatum TaxID=133383 RepID=A0A1R0GVF6_9FUNG|nr:hypothetical protein AYI68_g5039 [Smittium mucronatum]